MQLDAQSFLRLVKGAGTLYTWDIESNGLNGDYGSIICLSVKPYGKKPTTFRVEQLGNDRRLVREAKEMLEQADAWATYYGKGFDVKMLNTRLLKWGLPPVEPRPHLDMYFQLKSKLATGRRSQSHMLNFLGTPEQKMTVSPDVWAGLVNNFRANMKTLVARCESDTIGLEALVDRTGHLVRDITR